MATTNNINKRKTSARKGKGSTAHPASDTPVSYLKVTRVCLGMLLLVAALFAIAAMTSYILEGSSDFSLCEGRSASEILLSDQEVTNVGGKLGLLTAHFLINDCFGLPAYCLPIWVIILALRLIGSFRFHVVKHFLQLAILMVWLSIVLAVCTTWIPLLDQWHVNVGGNHGRYIHRLLLTSVGPAGEIGLILLSVLFFLVYLCVRVVDRITEFLKFKKIRAMREKLRQMGTHSHADAGNATEEGNEQNFQDETPVTIEFNIDKDNPHAEDPAPDDHEDNPRKEDEKGVKGEEKEPEFVIETTQATEQRSGKIEHLTIDTPYDPHLSLAHYKFPPPSLLEHSDDSTPQVDEAEQNANKERIIRVLKSFGVEIRTIRATIGPTITLYEITPAEGMRISKIRNLEDDIALSLAADGIRIIAPIPGKGTIGIEVPNKKKCIVSMESLINSKTYAESKMELPCALGKTITNEVFMVDLAKAPHMLVAGATGMGKSVGLNAIVTSLLYKKHPTELKIVMVDPKKVEFSIYAPIANQFLAKLEDEPDAIITDNQRVVKTLNALCKLMDDRYSLLKAAQVRNIVEYNKKFCARKLNPEEGHDYMPYYVVIIDEFGDLIMTAGKEIELPICRIAQLARAVGIHMIIATQRPTTRIITGTIKANFPARIAFKVSSMIDSRIILDRPGANQLIGRGDMLYLQAADPVRVQCAFVDTPEVNRICEFISQQQHFPEMTYLPEPPADGESSAANEVDMSKLDPLFGEVARMVVGENAGSTSNIQRKFAIGYNRAGKLMDQLEKAGIVGPVNGSKPREILINSYETLDILLHNLGFD